MTFAWHDATLTIVRTFNTEGPVVAADHYHVPPLERIDLDEVLGLVRDKKYFVLHAPRQTGKTSALLALRDLLNAGHAGDYRCVYANVEDGQAMRENVAEGVRTVLAELALQASMTLGDETLEDLWPGVLERVGPGKALRHALLRWSMADPRPLVLLIDEIDALVGDTLLAVLRQLRTGYVDRPERFPHSIVLCGVRDVRDYRIHSTAENRMVLGGSAFNIKARSLRLGDFCESAGKVTPGRRVKTTPLPGFVVTRTIGGEWSQCVGTATQGPMAACHGAPDRANRAPERPKRPRSGNSAHEDRRHGDFSGEVVSRYPRPRHAWPSSSTGLPCRAFNADSHGMPLGAGRCPRRPSRLPAIPHGESPCGSSRDRRTKLSMR